MTKKTLVLGASENKNRYSYFAIDRLLANGHEVRAVGKKEGKVKEVHIYINHQKFRNIDTITLYLNRENQKTFYNYIIDLAPKRVIFNPGTENEELEVLLNSHSIYFERSCTLVLLSTGVY